MLLIEDNSIVQDASDLPTYFNKVHCYVAFSALS